MPLKKSAILLLMLTFCSAGLLVFSNYKLSHTPQTAPGKCCQLKTAPAENVAPTPIMHSIFQLRA